VRIAVRHILPNLANTLIVQATLTTAFAILQEAGTVISWAGRPATGRVVGSGHQLTTTLHHQPDVVGSVGPGCAIFWPSSPSIFSETR